jgi:hypothetical protein
MPTLIAFLGNATKAAHTEFSENEGLVEHSLRGTVEKLSEVARDFTKIADLRSPRPAIV